MIWIVIILSECEFNVPSFQVETNHGLSQKYGMVVNHTNEPIILTRQPTNSFEAIGNENWASIWRINNPIGEGFLLFIVHFLSKLDSD